MSSPTTRRSMLTLTGAVATLRCPSVAWALVDPTAGPWRFFTPAEAAFVTAACDRIIPADPPGPGAVDAGCVIFIDNELAGAFGSGARLYRRGPFKDGLPQQSYQLPYTPAQLYRHAIAQIDAALTTQEGPGSFARLPAPARDDLLQRLQHESSESWAREFVDMLVRNTVEGYFADPVYGGNRGMAGWRMIGFPGAYAQYVEFVDAHNRPFHREPMSMAQLAHQHSSPH